MEASLETTATPLPPSTKTVTKCPIEDVSMIGGSLVGMIVTMETAGWLFCSPSLAITVMYLSKGAVGLSARFVYFTAARAAWKAERGAGPLRFSVWPPLRVRLWTIPLLLVERNSLLPSSGSSRLMRTWSSEVAPKSASPINTSTANSTGTPFSTNTVVVLRLSSPSPADKSTTGALSLTVVTSMNTVTDAKLSPSDTAMVTSLARLRGSSNSFTYWMLLRA